MRAYSSLARRVFVQGQRLASRAGLNIVPNHYYAQIADLNELSRTTASWAKRAPMQGIGTDLVAQSETLRRMVLPYIDEYRDNAAYLEGQANGYGPGFGYVEAQCLHGVLRSLQPRRVLEIGSGVSTHCAIHAMALNPEPGRITCIEPYPTSYLRHLTNIELVERKVQDIDMATVDALESGDLLFIDTSHAIKPGGDVPFIYLHILPRLKSGVVVQIHDVYLPYLYQRDLFDSVFQWSETVLLAAMLTNNPRLSVLFSLSMLHYDRPELLTGLFPGYRRADDQNGLASRQTAGHFPSSIYLRID